MGIMVKDNGGDFEEIPTGVHRAVCINVYDVGVQPGFQGGPPAHKVVILWELEPKDSKGRRFQITKIYTLSIGDKSNLGNDLASWRGRPFTAGERQGFDLDAIKGKPCQVNVVAGAKPGKTKVGSVLPAARDQATGRATNHWAPETKPDYVPNFVQKMMDDQIIQMPKRQVVEVVSGDGFTDDIPF